MSYAIVIPSRTASNVIACITALRVQGEYGPIVVVWDGRDGNTPYPAQLQAAEGVAVMAAPRNPWSFAGACNVGINVAGSDDVVLLNDDCLLRTYRGLGKLAEMAGNAGVGILSAAVLGAAHPAHALANQKPRIIVHRRLFVPFTAVWIARVLIQQVGLLDERFEPGGYEDNDYCRRTKEAGWSIATDYSVVVDHEELPHTFRPAGQPQTYNLGLQMQRYREKWGDLQ